MIDLTGSLRGKLKIVNPNRYTTTSWGAKWERLIVQALAKKTWERQADASALITQIERAARPRLRL
jgi:hypothetical protein